MKWTSACLASVVLAAAPFSAGAAASGATERPEILSNCTRRVVTETSGYTKCFDGTGTQRAKGYCYNGVDYSIARGPWAGQDVASWATCPYGRALVDIFVDFYP